MPIALHHLRRYAIARSLFKPTTLKRAIDKLGFVQADPIRAPARAQDLTLRHRVNGYRAGDLERRYPKLGLEEDFFVNYGFLTRTHHALMHPRKVNGKSSPTRAKRMAAILAFVRERGAVHPREVDAHFLHGRVTNWFGGSSNATTQLLDHMHYRGMLRVARRDGGTRVYIARDTPGEVIGGGDPKALAAAGMDALIDVIVRKYAPLPGATLGNLIYRLKYAAPQWDKERKAALTRAKQRFAHARIDGTDWYWPADERPQSPAQVAPRRRGAVAHADLTRSFGIGAASRFFGTGPIASRRIRRSPSANSAITLCLCCGTNGLSAGAMCPWSAAK